jgi:hypothetical protein
MYSALRRRISYANVASTAALFFAVTGVAVAAIPGPNGVVHGCYKRNKGTLRLVNPRARCDRSEKAIAWNRTGPAGPRGPQGIQGTQGTQGIQGNPGVPATKLFAYVHEDGTFVRGTPGASSAKIVLSGTDTFYEVTFPQDISACVPLVTNGNTSGNGVVAGEIAARIEHDEGASNTNKVEVDIHQDGGALGTSVSGAFNLAVFC